MVIRCPTLGTWPRHGMATSTALLGSKLSSTAADGLRRTPDLTISLALLLCLSTVHRLMLRR